MFSGIVEATSSVINFESLDQAERIWVKRPSHFDDLKIGDSIATNGVCLTVEKFDSETIQFCLGKETLTLLEKTFSYLKKFPVNLERSLQFGSRVHGHLVTGHVDSVAKVHLSEASGDVWDLVIECPQDLISFFWKKGSACLNGVSLTINKTDGNLIYFCLIPETIKATNLKFFKKDDFLNLESDYLAKAYIHSKGSHAD